MAQNKFLQKQVAAGFEPGYCKTEKDGQSANESYGRGFRETTWKPSVFGLDEIFANDNVEQFVTFCYNQGISFVRRWYRSFSV